MAKPIFILEIPRHFTREEVIEHRKSLEANLTDYHVLIIQKDNIDIDVKVFYEKDFTQINFEELKNIVEDIKI